MSDKRDTYDLYTDTELFRLIAQDDHDAFATIVQRFRADIYGQAITFLKDAAAAKDIVQEVFLALWKQREGLPAIDVPANFIFILARNKVVNELKKGVPVPIFDNIERFDHGHVTTHAYIDGKDLQQMIHQAVEQLPPQRQKIFKLSRYEGLKYQEIADQLGISTSTVRLQIIQALAFIRQFIRVLILSFCFIDFF